MTYGSFFGSNYMLLADKLRNSVQEIKYIIYWNKKQNQIAILMYNPKSQLLKFLHSILFHRNCYNWHALLTTPFEAKKIQLRKQGIVTIDMLS